MTVKHVGDLSDADGRVIAERARAARVGILEFGAGGSTQIMAQMVQEAPRLPFFSVETTPRWIELTRARLEKLGVRDRVAFVDHAGWQRRLPKGKRFDLIFVDGAWPLRRAFARESWPLLSVGGVMLFHDTRRAKDIANALALAQEFFEEVARLDVNVAGSNITVVTKRARAPYVNWQTVEGKPGWRYGNNGVVPESFWKK